MSPATLKRRKREQTVETSVEVPRKLAEIEGQALKTLRKLGEEEEDASILLFEAAQAGMELRGRRSPKKHVEVSNFKKDVFVSGSEQLAYPLLFSASEHVSMSRPDLVTEISVIMSMARPSLIEGPHIYSVQVLEPRDVTGQADLDKLSPYFGGSVPTDIKSGYLYGPMLYESPTFVRNVVLQNVLGSAKEIEVSLRDLEGPVRKRVTLSDV